MTHEKTSFGGRSALPTYKRAGTDRRPSWAFGVFATMVITTCASVNAGDNPALPTRGITTGESNGDDLASGGPRDQWLSYGRNHSEQRFSPLADIDQTTVSRLGLIWYLDLPNTHSLEATPLAIDGILYFTTSWAVVHAVDATTGKELWTYDPKSLEIMYKNPLRQRTQWGTNRGVAFWKGKVYVGTPDGRLVALNHQSGKPLWSVQTFDTRSPRYITSAPRAFNGKIIIGHSGGDTGSIRGYVTAYDAETGRQIWRWYVVPGDPKRGFENDAMAMAAKTWRGEWWKIGGGGAVWNAITYDPDFNRIYIGTGNGAPWNQRLRSPTGGDNLFLASIVALDADTGAYAWHYQINPGETWDFDAATDMVLATLAVNGHDRQVLMQAPKNGFFYVIDRSNGKLISADEISKQNWASSIDLQTGRPVEIPQARFQSGETFVWPGMLGAHSWQPMSYSPDTGLVYVPTQSLPSIYDDRGINRKTWHPNNFGANFGIKPTQGDIPREAGTSALIAWDPLARKERWRITLPGAWSAGTLATRGDLVFAGNAQGQFVAYGAQTGNTLWSFDAQRGIVAPPISYAIEGRQYISVLADWSGAAASAAGGSLFSQHGWTYRSEGRRLLTFALDGVSKLPPPHLVPEGPLDVPSYQIDPQLAKRGSLLYAEKCSGCHGTAVISGGGAPDLRASSLAADPQTLETVVRHGALMLVGMPQFHEMTSQKLRAIYAYVRERARADVLSK